jgi:hypothetical protein
MKTLLFASLVLSGVLVFGVAPAAAQIHIAVSGFPGVDVRVGPGVAVSVGGIGVSVGGYGYFPYGDPSSGPYSSSSPYYGYTTNYYGDYDAAPIAAPANSMAESSWRATLVNPAGNGATLAFQVNGQPYALAPGTQQEVAAGPGVEIVFDRGGPLGVARYSLNGGIYDFTPTPGGWELYQRPAK